jgi:hypothetical protein
MTLFEFLRAAGAAPSEATHVELAEFGRPAQAWKPCSQCAGVGRVEAFAHIEDGMCFPCDGTGRLPVTTLDQRRLLAALALWWQYEQAQAEDR